MKKYLRLLALLLVISIVFGTIYASGQQILRMSANDPQIQIAQDAAAQLDQGNPPGSLTATKIDLAVSQAPFIVVYDKQGKNIASDVYIGNTPLKDIPFGVLQHTHNPYYAVTWAPQPNIRLAAVVVKSHDYYVVSARSLTEVEKRENTILKLTALGWLVTLLIIATAYYLPKYQLAKN